MADDTPFTHPDLAALAAEACDLWQSHLEACAGDPQVRAELLKLAEPSQRLFAGWAAMMQSAAHAGAAPSPASPAPAAPDAASSGSAPLEPASDGGALRLAQLAHRLGELEKRVAGLEAFYGAGGEPVARRGRKH